MSRVGLRVSVRSLVMGLLRKLMGALDRWQRRTRWAGVAYAVVKKFGDDNANLLVVSLAWYGFTAIFPLLLVVVTVFGFIGQQSIGIGILRTLHEFPVVGRASTRKAAARCTAARWGWSSG